MSDRLTIDEFTEIAERWRESSASSRSYAKIPWKVTTDIGDGWLVASLGAGADGQNYYIVTDGVHGSELQGDAKADADLIVHAPDDIKRLGKEFLALTDEVEQLRLELAALKVLRASGD